MKKNLLLLAISLFFALLMGEVTLRLLLPSADQYYVWTPGMEYTFAPDKSVISGVYDEAYFKINALGMRGDEWEMADTSAYSILTIGGSTTINTYLDQQETWTYQLQNNLKNKANIEKVRVGNIGKSGLSTFHHIRQLEQLLPQYPRVDKLVFLVGINDLQLLLSRGKYDAGSEQEILQKTFMVLPDKFHPWYKRSGYWHLLRLLKHSFYTKASQAMIIDREAHSFIHLREHRKHATQLLDTLPDLNQTLATYTQHLNRLIDIAQQHKTEITFMTQPVLWTMDMPQELQDWLWLGGVGNFQEEGGTYYTSAALQKGIEQFNQTLMEVCEQRGVTCVDLYSEMVGNPAYFYDDCHFTEKGAEKVVEVLLQAWE